MKRLSFRMKLTLIFVSMIIIQGFLIGLYSYSHTKEIVMKTKKSELADSVNRIDININVKVRSITELADSAVTSHIIRDILASDKNDIELINKKKYIDEYINNLEKSIDAISNIMILCNSNIAFSSNDTQNELRNAENAFQIKEYQKIAMDNKGKVVWLGITDPLYKQSDNKDNKVISVISSIMDESNSRMLGTLVMELETSPFSNLLLGNQSTFQNQYITIVDKENNIICSNKNVDNSWIYETDQNFKKGIRRFELEWNGNKFYACGQYNGLTSWKTYSIVPLSNLFPQFKLLKNSILFFVAMSTIGVIVLIYIISYTLTQPLKKLLAAMETVWNGNFHIQIPNSRTDEIGKLIQSFNYMINKINILIKEVYQEKIAQKNAEIEALQAQINPHFLYNTLDSINWMLIDKGEYEISDIIISLGNLMKYSIDKNSPNKSLVTIEEEVQYIISYLHIQKNRLEDRLNYILEIPDTVKNYKVPKLILQPLVENAIIHGIEPSKKGGTIRITAKETTNLIIITIEDNGRGMDADKLNQLSNVQKNDDSYTSIGVRNVDKRIRLHFGDVYKLKIESTLGIGTKFTMTIPKKG